MGLAGGLFVRVISGFHFIADSLGPNKVSEFMLDTNILMHFARD